MKFIKPKNAGRIKVEWKVSGETKAIIHYYAEYTGYSEDDVVDEFLKANLLDDPDFKSWVAARRRNKRMQSLMGLAGEVSYE